MRLKGIIKVVMIAVFIAASVSQSYGVEVYRKLTKISTTAKGVAANNKYGNITVKHWDKQEVSVIVKITAKASTEEAAKEITKSIDIKFNESGGVLSASSVFPIMLEMNGDKKLSVDYEITLPSSYTIDLKNKYGNIVFPPTTQKGKTDIDAKYGNINGSVFTGALSIDSKYGNISIDKIGSGDITCGYCKGCVINEAGTLDIEMEYSDLTMKSAGKVNAELAYSGLKVNDISTLDASGKYSNINIGTMQKSLSIDGFRYSKISVAGTSPSVNKISITGAGYAEIDLVLDKMDKISPDFGYERYSTYNTKEITPKIIGVGGTPVIIRGNYTNVKLRK